MLALVYIACIFAFSFRQSLAASSQLLLDAEGWIHTRRNSVPHNVAPGITGLLVLDGQVKLFGDGAQRLNGAAADKDTLMEIGSLSKTLVGLALAALVTQGKMSWNDPVRHWLGKDFAFGPDEYVRKSLTVKDLLAHRTGLAEGQGDFGGSFLPMPDFLRGLKTIEPMNTLRDTFAYSNTAWMVAGEVLRAATNSNSWCAALHSVILDPFNLTRTFCHRNEVPTNIARKHLAAVHKMDPCRGSGKLATYEFVATGRPDDFAWGAADASGSVISSVADMATVLQLLLGELSSNVVAPKVLQDMMTGHMVTPRSWPAGLGVVGWDGTSHSAGHVASAGLGFDLVGQISLAGKGYAYAGKSGDTDMHKARLGLLPDLRAGVLLLSNLGGSVGGPLTAMKFGALVKLASGTDDEANAATDAALNASGFWHSQWDPTTSCTPCRAAASSRQCLPSGLEKPPLGIDAFTGSFGTSAYGTQAILLEVSKSSLSMTFGAINAASLTFSNSSLVMQGSCSNIAKALRTQSAAWAATELSKLAALSHSNCTLVEWVLPPEVPSGGVSAKEGKVAFPYGCGIIPLPDGPSVYVVSYQGRGIFVSFLGEVLPATYGVAQAGIVSDLMRV